MGSSFPLYFDNHATTSVDPRVLDAMLPFFTEHFGNAESVQHPYGWKAKAAVEKARAQVARALGAEAGEIIFTSGATESIHLAILGYLAEQGERRHIITGNAEHKATLEVCARAEKLGHELTILPVDRFGRLTAEDIRAAIRPNTAIVSLMHGNNEIGSIHPIHDIGALLHEENARRNTEQRIAFHVDAAQTVGKAPIDVCAMNIDLLSLSAHKFHGPKGMGALYARRKNPRVHLTPYIVGGGQERGLRGGTHNVPGIVGLGQAAELAHELLPAEIPRLTALRDRVIREVTTRLEHVALNGHPTERLCNNLNFTLFGVSSDSLLLDMSDIAYSSASACASGTVSHVLRAIGQEVNDPLATSVRFGLGRFTTEAEIDTLIARLVETVQKLRSISRR